MFALRADAAGCTPEPVDFARGYSQLTPGLTVEQVSELVGHDMKVISPGHDGQDRLIQWEGPDKSSFVARFADDRLERVTDMYPPPQSSGIEHPASEPGAGRQRAIPPPREEVTPYPPPARLQRAQSEEDRRTRIVRVYYPFGRRAYAEYKHAKLPRYSLEIRRGPHELIIENPLPRDVKIGIRSDNSGMDLSMRRESRNLIQLKNGTYTIYYTATGDPTILYKAGTVKIDSPPGPIIFPIAGQMDSPTGDFPIGY
jgi:hypothetical protein